MKKAQTKMKAHKDSGEDRFLTPQDCLILTIGDRCWGKGATLNDALKNMRKNAPRGARRYVAYIVHPDSRVDEMGDICFPSGMIPKEFHRTIPRRTKEE